MLHSDKYIQALINEQPFFEIHQENVLGVQMDVFKNRPKSLVDFIESSAAHGDKPYLIFKDQVITFNQHLILVKKAAHILQTKYEVQQGDRVAIYAANSPEWIIFFWATVSLGAIACGLNGWWKGSEAIKAINDAVKDNEKGIKNSIKLTSFSFEMLGVMKNTESVSSFVLGTD